MISPALLARCWPRCPPELLDELARGLSAAMGQHAITTVARAAAFLGQLAWECDEARLLEEPSDKAKAYVGRRDLGNIHPGDGVVYRGRGLVQITGRANYRAAGAAVWQDLEAHPERAADPGPAAAIAGWYWSSRAVNALADAGEWRAVTQAINGRATDGPPSYHERRMERVHRCALALGVGASLVGGTDAALALGSPVVPPEPEGGGSVRT